MGLLMDSIHTPSVSSDMAGGRSFDGPKDKAMSLLELMSEKQKVEEELSALGSVLDSVSDANSSFQPLCQMTDPSAHSSMAST